MKILAIALNTGREAVRNKVMYAILLFAALVTSIAAVFGAASIGGTTKFVKDFSFLSISVFGVVATVVLGVNLLSKELDRRTIYNVLSKPVGRGEFLLGKYLGMLGTVSLMVALMGAALLLLLWALEGRFAWELLPVVGAMILELGLLLAVAIFYSSIVVTPALAGLFTAATFVAGRSTWLLSWFFEPGQPIGLRYLMKALYAVLPHLDRLYIADVVLAGQSMSVGDYAFLCTYAAAYASVLLLLSVSIFRRREFV
jgi:ABC-type transport system involved in multi-copper enzyme maturation permease subunit